MSADSPGLDQHEGSSLASTEVETTTDVCTLLVVIVNYKTARLTERCLETLRPELDMIPGGRVTVVENASGDGEALTRMVADRGWGDWVRLEILDRNGGFSFGNNRGIEPALQSANPPRYILLLNADTEVRPGAFRILIDFMDQNRQVGISGCSFENLDGSDWHFAFRFADPLGELEGALRFGLAKKILKNHVVTRTMDQDRPQPVDWVAGACMMIRREVFEAVGLMDEGYFLYFEEVDFCLQASRKGWPCWYVPQSKIMHIGGQSTGVTERDRRPARTPTYWFASRSRYHRKNHGLIGEIAFDLAYGVGYTLWRIRRFVFRKPDHDPPHHLVDFWKHSIFFRGTRPT